MVSCLSIYQCHHDKGGYGHEYKDGKGNTLFECITGTECTTMKPIGMLTGVNSDAGYCVDCVSGGQCGACAEDSPSICSTCDTGYLMTLDGYCVQAEGQCNSE